jgi:WD40 repeat protein
VFLHGKRPTTVSYDGSVTTWDESSGSKVQSLKLLGNLLSGVPGSLQQAALANDGRHLAVAASNGVVYILDLRGFAPR